MGLLGEGESITQAFIVQGVVIADGYPQGMPSPKLMPATVSIQPYAIGQARASIETAAKVGGLSRRSARHRVTMVCEAAAEEIVAHVSAEPVDAE